MNALSLMVLIVVLSVFGAFAAVGILSALVLAARSLREEDASIAAAQLAEKETPDGDK